MTCPPAPLEPRGFEDDTRRVARAAPELPEGDAWISHEPSERFGVISFSGIVPPEIRELIGKNPEIGEEFEIED